MSLISRNPNTGKIIATFKEHSPAQVEKKLALSEKTFQSWRWVPFAKRKKLMLAVAKRLRSRKNYYGKIMTIEMGKPIGAAVAEVEKCAWVCDYFAQNAEKFLTREKKEVDTGSAYVQFEPLGVVLAIMPWNFPFWQVFRFAAPALMAGNVGLLKHAGNVSQSALALEEVFRASGFPNGAFQTLLISPEGGRVERVIADDRVKAVTLTGSEKAGSVVAAIAGREIKKTVMELGGSDPFIVFADADLKMAAKVATDARLVNNGQSCIAAKRFIVEKKVLSEFVEQYRAQFALQIVGDPMDPKTTVGPLVTANILSGVEKQVKQSVRKGARVIIGGKRGTGPGFFFEPTILTNVNPGMPSYDEEVFGPVAAVISARDADEAIKIANDHRYGLASSVWTRNPKLAQKAINQIEAGAVFVNEMVKSDPRLPFGGIKKSGYGRELADYGIREFVNIKTVKFGGKLPEKRNMTE